MVDERLTRYQLGEIERLHDTSHQMCVRPKYLHQQLERIGLPPRVSRFEVAQRVREIERDGGRLK